MRKLILTRGAPGAGKSTLIRQAGLEPYSLSMDTLRLTKTGPIMFGNGHMGISQEHNQTVWEEFKKLTGGRMMRGELLVSDTTLSDPSDINDWLARADAFYYDVAILDFSGLDIDTLMERNNSRDQYRRVSRTIMERIQSEVRRPLNTSRQGSPVQIIDATQDIQAVLRQIQDFIHVPVMEFSHYRKVVHVGDLQGCGTVLYGEGGLLEKGFEDDAAYIFIGDLVDRGIENGELMKWLMENAQGRENVYFVWGNHEDHLRRWAQGLPAVSGEFRNRTQPQLEAAGIDPGQLNRFLSTFHDVVPYSFHGQKVMACHAGLANVPPRFELISQAQYSRGTGNYDDPVDDQFFRYAPNDWIQVHGHRNSHLVPIQANTKSFNLEEAVEFGGNLRAVVLDENGWTPISIRNKVFLPMRQRQIKAIPGTTKRNDPMPLGQVPAPWLAQESNTKLSDATVKAMLEHSGVRLRESMRHPNVVSLNFTKNVFFDASWDEVTTKARGMFIDRETNEIVARGYDKFFNVGEREETKLSNLLDTLKFPVMAYVKENGFLGLIGYDKRTDELFLSSKASPDGEFSDHFRRIFNTALSEGRRESLRRWLRDNEACMAVEVIDPVNDPHMIEYDADRLIVLDIFHRGEDGQKLEYSHMKAVCERFGLEAKQRGIEFRSREQLEGWYKAIEGNLKWRGKNGADIEGMVLEDASGYLTKVKVAHYAFWKRMRSAKDRLAKLMSQRPKLTQDPHAQQRQEILDQLGRTKAALVGASEEEAQVLRTRLQALGKSLGQLPKPPQERVFTEQLEQDITKCVNRDPHPLAKAFMEWCLTQDDEHLSKSSIIQLRKQFNEQAKPDPSLMEPIWTAFAQAASEDDGVDDEPAAPMKKPRP